MGSKNLTRREFIRLFGSAALAYAGFPKSWLFYRNLATQPRFVIDRLPDAIKGVLESVPDAEINADGFLQFHEQRIKDKVNAPLFPTLWNLQHRRLRDRLLPNFPWGIVFHWYGDTNGFDQTIAGYLRGFNSTRQIKDYETQTSAHFLIGDAYPVSNPNLSQVGIIQTQSPDKDGTPFLASHLQLIDYAPHKDHKQYFVNALYQLSYEEPKVHNLLQDLFDGPKIDPNMRTLAVEITGVDFQTPGNFPSDQKLANILALLWALMRRYRIPAANIMGHHEIQLGKSDPGKLFMAVIRYFIGLLALIRDDGLMIELVFGQFTNPGEDFQEGIIRYFKFIRDYLVIVGTPRQVYEWEIQTGYWSVFEQIAQSPQDSLPSVSEFISPFSNNYSFDGKLFLNPENHEGVDLYPVIATNWGAFQDVKLIAPGVCIFNGLSNGCCLGNTQIFRHRLKNGGNIVTVYSNLEESHSLQVGQVYKKNITIGNLKAAKDKDNQFLHFAVAYGSTWDRYPDKYIGVPPGEGPEWILNHYLEPGVITDNWTIKTPRYLPLSHQYI